MLIVRQWPAEATRKPDRPCYWVAETVINGRTYAVRSRYGAVNKLARLLVAVGIPDAPLAVTQPSLKGEIIYRSFYEAAKWTYAESATRGPRRVRWVNRIIKHQKQAADTGAKHGQKTRPGTPVPVTISSQNLPIGD